MASAARAFCSTKRMVRLSSLSRRITASTWSTRVGASPIDGSSSNRSRALMAKPRLLLLDEPSMGLAPTLVDHVLAVIRRLKDDSLTILLVEQNARAALAIADRAYVLETGRVTLSGTAAEIQADRRVREAYLGI